MARERQRPDHSGDMQVSASARKRGRSRRRRRRLALGAIKSLFWLLVLAGVFVLGIGYGRTISSDDETSTRKVTLEQDAGAPITATLPTRTITVTKTVAKAPTAAAKRAAAAAAAARPTG
ncbi:MAG: hypothetical protein JWN72_1446 [Thermoleophilia bacterium]|nr:hypothetical protein [Thermoleophilia bacterium]